MDADFARREAHFAIKPVVGVGEESVLLNHCFFAFSRIF